MLHVACYLFSDGLVTHYFLQLLPNYQLPNSTYHLPSYLLCATVMESNTIWYNLVQPTLWSRTQARPWQRWHHILMESNAVWYSLAHSSPIRYNSVQLGSF